MKSLKLRVGIFGAEPWSEKMRAEIENELDITALNIYGLSEIMGPGVAMECIEGRNGMHILRRPFPRRDHRPRRPARCCPGETGELVFTTITKEAFPLIRYRTRDISRLMPEPCRCGRTLVRMERVTGRSDDMLIIRGVNVFPSQIESSPRGHRGARAALPDHRGPGSATSTPSRSRWRSARRSSRTRSDEVKILQNRNGVSSRISRITWASPPR